MAINLDNKCPYGKHDLHPIIEGTQTVGIVCLQCGHSVRENMEHSSITVGDKEILFPPTFFEECKIITTRDFKQQYHRKDPRF
jgi:hypothetical protein